MEDNTAGFSIGDVLDELGVNIPTSDEQIPDTGEVTEQSEAEVPEEAVADGADNTNEDTEEIEEEPTEDADEESEDPEADEDEPEAEDRTVKKLNRRVDKLTARAKTAEERAASLESELAEARDAVTKAQPIVLQSASDPLSNVTRAEDLDARLASANVIIDDVPELIARADYEGGEVELPMGDGTTRRFTKTELQERLRLAKSIIKNEPVRRKYLAERDSFVNEAQQTYPEFFKETPQRQMMVETLKTYPELSRLPNIELIMGDAIRGQQMRFSQYEALQKKAAGAKVSPATATAKPTLAPKVISPNSAPKTKSKPAALDALKKSGNREAAEQFMSSIFD